MNAHTAAGVNWPVGKCRLAVRGLAASRWRSARRLNAIAALRAKTMHTRMPASSNHENCPLDRHARAALKRANGSANSVWLKRIISSSVRRRCSMVAFLGSSREPASCAEYNRESRLREMKFSREPWRALKARALAKARG